MTSDQLIEKIKQGENETFELKAEVRDPLLLSKLIGSFANNKGGQIVIGVREPIEIVGTDANRLLTIVDRARTALKPTPNFTTEIITVDNKELLLLFSRQVYVDNLKLSYNIWISNYCAMNCIH